MFSRDPPRFELPMVKVPEFLVDPPDWLKLVIDRVPKLLREPFSLLMVPKA